MTIFRKSPVGEASHLVRSAKGIRPMRVQDWSICSTNSFIAFLASARGCPVMLPDRSTASITSTLVGLPPLFWLSLGEPSVQLMSSGTCSIRMGSVFPVSFCTAETSIMPSFVY